HGARWRTWLHSMCCGPTSGIPAGSVFLTIRGTATKANCAPCACRASQLDHLIGAGEQRGRDGEADVLCARDSVTVASLVGHRESWTQQAGQGEEVRILRFSSVSRPSATP